MSGRSSCFNDVHEKKPAISKPSVINKVTLRFATASCVRRITSSSLKPFEWRHCRHSGCVCAGTAPAHRTTNWSRPRPARAGKPDCSGWRGALLVGNYSRVWRFARGGLGAQPPDHGRDKPTDLRQLLVVEDAQDLPHHLDAGTGDLIDQAAAGVGQFAIHHASVIQAMPAHDQAVTLDAIHDTAGSWEPNLEPLGDPAHGRGALLAEQEQAPHLAEREFLSDPFRDVVGILFPKVREGFNDALNPELPLRCFAHGRIVSPYANSCASSE